MSVFTETNSTSAITEQIRLRKPRNQFHHHHHHHQEEFPISPGEPETDPNPHISRSSKSAISSLFLSPFSINSTSEPTPTKKKGTAFRGLGCTASAAQQVSVPAVIRSSAEWEGKRVKKKKNQHNQKQQKMKKDSLKICSENMLQMSVGDGSNSNSNCDTNNHNTNKIGRAHV